MASSPAATFPVGILAPSWPASPSADCGSASSSGSRRSTPRAELLTTVHARPASALGVSTTLQNSPGDGLLAGLAACFGSAIALLTAGRARRVGRAGGCRAFRRAAAIYRPPKPPPVGQRLQGREERVLGAGEFLEGLEIVKSQGGLLKGGWSKDKVRAPPARLNRQRCMGNVKESKKNVGVIRYGEEEFKFHMSSVPRPFLEENQFRIPLGAPVEFEVFEDDKYGQIADNLFFPINKTMEELGLIQEVIEGAANALGCDPTDNPDAPSLITPAPVQSQSIPKILDGEELVIAAETGSGKTLAYMLPLVQKVKELANTRNMNYGLEYKASSPLGLIVCPTRELAIQAATICKLICYICKLRVRLVHGGSGNWVSQRKTLSSVVDILVATPDRLQKFREANDIIFEDIKYIAIDEADFMLTQGFADLEELLQRIEKESRNELHYTLVTASITKPLWALFQKERRWRNMRVLESKSLHRPQTNCSHCFLQTRGRDKLEMLIGLLRAEVTGRVPSKQTLVFCNNISSCKSISYQLKLAFEHQRAYRCIGTLHKDMQWEDRQDVIARFARGELKIVICTDIAQRGLDLPHCGHVINFDFPMNSIDYLHRAGRTARYGESGSVTSLVRKVDKVLAKAVERACQLGKPINNLTSDRRDYLRGGALHDLVKRNPGASGKEKGIPASRPYAGSLR